MSDRSFNQSNESFADINDLIQTHLEERDWHIAPSRSLATSISLEASELLEHYQWSDKPAGSKEELGAELADILIYAFQYAQMNEIDIPAAIRAKLQKAAEKYPAEKFKGQAADNMREVWLETKKNYHKDGL